MMTPQIILHVGLHKTGTTFLQEQVFPALAGVRFVHPLHVQRPDDGPIERFVFEILFRNPACIDLDRHREAIAAWLATVTEPTVLISSEAIVGWPFENHSNLATNAELLAAVFPEAKIWLVVRRQDKWVDSAYAQLLKAGFSPSIERYLNADGDTHQFGRYNHSVYNGPNLDAHDLDWNRFDLHYRGRWGHDAVLTLPFELFTADSEDFLRRFYSFAALGEQPVPSTEARVNERWSPLAAGVAKLVNRVPMPVKRAIRDRVGASWHPAAVLERGLARLGPVVPNSLTRGRARHLSPELGAALLRLHRWSNQALAARIGVELDGFGYY